MVNDYGSGSSVTVGAATVTTVLPARVGNNRRTAFAISNYGANSVYIVCSDYQQAATGYGILLLANSVFSDSDSGGYQCWSGNITAYSAAGTTLSVQERVMM